MGLLALLLYALFGLLWEDASDVFEAMLILFAFIMLVIPQSRGFRDDVLVWVSLGWLVYQGIFLLFVVKEYPELASEQARAGLHYAKIAMVPIIAWWLRGNARVITLMLFLAALGFLLRVTFQDEGVLDSLDRVMAHERVGFGFHWEHVSVFAAFSLLTFGLLARHIVAIFGRFRVAGYAVVSVGAAYSGFIVLASQTRATWLGLLAAAGVVVGWALVRRWRTVSHGVSVSRLARGAVVLSVALVAAFVIENQLNIAGLVEKRLAEEREVISKIASGELGDMPSTSVGMRVIMWSHAVDRIGERPWFGWGPVTRRPLFESGALGEVAWKAAGIRHFHNQVLETMIAYGTLGIVFFVMVAYLIGRAIFRAHRQGHADTSFLAFGLAFFTYWFVVNMFESYFIYHTGAFMNALVGGVLYSFHFRADNNTKAEA